MPISWVSKTVIKSEFLPDEDRSSSLYTVYPVVTYPFEPTANPAAPFRAVASSGISLHCVHQSLSILYSQQSFSRWSFPRYPPHKYPRLPITNPAASSLALPSKSERRYHTPNVSSSSSEHEKINYHSKRVRNKAK